ncbi:hypothetical protein K2224_36960 (plasmid) [Streptomyces sp. BHT-5-2]|uniref:hypothetical protein n=1 Tax=Streptomyces sp. BHT-5-2 TaxID=2866715 RepID=UPI001C8EC727|nr:hypothetical protein [Streptomyces sp. BHT-5-2]QZL08653.1 hypothetical protein K2224_36960 [Streptomyces sp. BHT-5-2]
MSTVHQNTYAHVLQTAATEFVDKVERVGLASLLRAYGTSGLRKDAIVRDRPRLVPEMGDAVDLLCLSRPVPAHKAVSILTDPILDHLLGIGAATASGGDVELSHIRLVEHFGRLVFVGAVNNNGFGWYGRDSIGIGRQLIGARGRCLDVCSSTGCQTTVMAASATSVTAVEIDEQVAPLFELNMCINRSRAKVDALWCDVREAEFDTSFDTIAINAPMMPTFGILDLPWTGHGGPDGTMLLNAVMQRVPLAEHGRLVANAMILGNEHDLEADWLRQLAEERGWAVTVIPTDHEPLTADSSFVRSALAAYSAVKPDDMDSVMQELSTSWTANATDRLYFALVCATAGSGPAFSIASTALKGDRWCL